MNEAIASFAYGAIKALMESGPEKESKRTRTKRVKVTRPAPPQMKIPFPDLGADGPNPFDAGKFLNDEPQPLQQNTKLKDIPVSLRDTVNPEMYHPSRETDSSGTQDTIPWMSR